MTKQQFDMMVSQMHQQGLTDDNIMRILYETFMSKKCSLEDYEMMVSWLGYNLSDEFYKDHGLKRKKK